MRDQTIGRAVLAVDDLLQRPDLGDLITRLRTSYRDAGQAWFLDQGDAATRQVRTGLAALTADSGAVLTGLMPSEHPDWIRLGLLTALMTWCAGKADTCVHVPDPRRPQPVAAAAWKPGLVVCSRCSHLTSLPRGSVRDRTCDSCGTVTGSAHGERGIWPVTVSQGSFMYMAGVCVDCRYWETDTPAAGSTSSSR